MVFSRFDYLPDRRCVDAVYSWPDGIMGSPLRSDFTRAGTVASANLPVRIDNERPRYQVAAAQGDVDTAGVFISEGADLINEVSPAGEIVIRLVDDAELRR
jgi:nitronate monooxygenase